MSTGNFTCCTNLETSYHPKALHIAILLNELGFQLLCTVSVGILLTDELILHMKITSLDISIPILNEERVLEPNILTLLDYLEYHLNANLINWKIVVIDNGSTDESPQILERMCKVFPRVHYLRIEQIGVGLALKTSWKESNADIVGYMDVDLATSLRHVREMLYAILDQKVDFVYGSRLHPNSIVKGRSLTREVTSRVFNWTLKHYLKVRFTDGMCGFKFLKRELAMTLIDRGAQNDGWFFSTELLYLAEKLNYKIYELPIEWKDSRESKVKIIRLSVQYLKSMYRIKKHYRTLVSDQVDKKS